ncbi:hypothetical protein [Planktotalea sp.]|uniref:hypothetical protein n=1 Tax=Planktotalea sp. TaxID=2029877 RepID=UPI0032974B02
MWLTEVRENESFCNMIAVRNYLLISLCATIASLVMIVVWLFLSGAQSVSQTFPIRFLPLAVGVTFLYALIYSGGYLIVRAFRSLGIQSSGAEALILVLYLTGFMIPKALNLYKKVNLEPSMEAHQFLVLLMVVCAASAKFAACYLKD